MKKPIQIMKRISFIKRKLDESFIKDMMRTELSKIEPNEDFIKDLRKDFHIAGFPLSFCYLL